ncbi:hypothetical protein [Streptomyces venezuelae]|uniref:hypothetical protein n=1 Tax=Streptomyces venezuelae TaxID=54571 RepID=UPI0037AD7E9B
MSSDLPTSRSSAKKALWRSGFWGDKLPIYSDRLQKEADTSATITAIASAVTGLGIWATVESSTKWWAQTIVCVVALVSAGAAYIAQTRHWSGGATDAREIAGNFRVTELKIRNALNSLDDGREGAQEVLDDEYKTYLAIDGDLAELTPVPQRLWDQLKKEEPSYEPTSHARLPG